MNHIIVHYSEIGTKGKNRPLFEKKLVDNIRSSLSKETYESIKRSYGRIIIELKSNSDPNKIEEKLKNISGIANFSFAYYSELNLEKIKQTLLTIADEHKGKTFRISAKRSLKDFKLNSQELNEVLGELLVKELGMKVSLDKPEIAFFIEITEKGAFVYTNKIKGFGGLPVGVTGKLISLISGGIDSPVASWKMFKRGCSIVYVHFFNDTISKKSVENKVEKLVEILSKYQFKTKLYIIPFSQLQTEIIKIIPSKYRMIAYRRIMFRIAEEMLKKENALGFVTGDSLAQVASQTLENLKVIYNITDYPILSPLMGEDKKEIIKLAEQIGTFETSILPYDDCCSFLVAEHPETKARLEDIERFEKNLKINNLIEDAVKNARARVFVNKRL